MRDKILIINAGSSSIKWQLLGKEGLKVIASGLAERIAVDGKQEMTFKNEKFSQEMKTNNHKEAVKAILSLWQKQDVIKDHSEITNVGFRVVHGSTYFSKPIILHDAEILKIEEAGKFAPLHNPGAVQAIKAFKELFSKSILSANFDTAFHTTIPSVNSTYPINSELTKELGIKKYGMHGISHRYITEHLKSITGKENVNFVNLHIGNGASLCAVKDSKSFDTSMGLTPLAGIMMGTRSGDIDPSIHEYVMKKKGYTIEEFTTILNKQSGMLGVSGVSSDLRDVTSAMEKGNTQAKIAFDLYVQRIVDYTASFINKVGNADSIVFTAGVGENSSLVRSEVCRKLEPMGIKIDEDKNLEKFGDYIDISARDSIMKIYVIRTNEELMIAKDAIALSKNK